MSEPSLQKTNFYGSLGMLAVWLALAGVLYVVFERIEDQHQASFKPYALSTGELVIPRQDDGHFHVMGEVNRQPVSFLVDTGASHVSVSDALAAQAGLPEGQAITLSTANGERPGQLVRSVPVRAGHLVLNDTTVIVGLVGLPPTKRCWAKRF